MRTILAAAVVVVAACGASPKTPTVEPSSSAGADVPPSVAAPEPASGSDRLEGKSVTLLRFGDVAFSADGAPMQRGDGDVIWQPERRLAIGAGDTRVRIETVEDGARLSLWVELDDLANVATVETKLALTPGERGATGDTGVTVFEGTPLSIVERRGDAVRVTNAVEALPVVDLSFDGWLDGSLLGTFYEARERERDPGMHAGYPVDNGTAVLDAPGGRTIATFRSLDAELVSSIEPLGPERDDFAMVAFRRPGFVAIGWVPVRLGRGPGPGGGGRGEGLGFDVPPGTCLHAGEAGAAIGEAIEVVNLERDSPPATDWWTGDVPSRWGRLPVWVHAVNDGYARCDGGVALTATLDAAGDAE